MSEGEGEAGPAIETTAIGDRLDAARANSGLSVAALARRAGASRETVHQALAGKASLLTVAKLARALDVPIEAVVPDLETQVRLRYPRNWQRRLLDIYGTMRGEPSRNASLNPQRTTQQMRESAAQWRYDSEAGRELEGFVSEMDRLVRTLSSAEAGELPVEAKIAILNGFEEAARVAGRRLPPEYWAIRRRLVEQATGGTSGGGEEGAHDADDDSDDRAPESGR